jgi:hypothetical protein
MQHFLSIENTRSEINGIAKHKHWYANKHENKQ